MSNPVNPRMYITYEHTKFNNDPSTISEGDFADSAESKKVVQKEGFVLKIGIFRTNLTSEDEIIGWKQLLTVKLCFSFTFQTTNVFTVIILQEFESGHPKDGIQKLILVT